MSDLHLQRLAEQVDYTRQELLARSMDIFGTYGATVLPLGSMATGTTDVLSDVDVWVTVPDDAAEEVINRRKELYRQVGHQLITWERKRYAPLGGTHGVVLYGAAGLELPVEVDYFIASETHTRPFAPYLASGELEQPGLPWESGADDPSRESATNFSALVTLWAAKYISRGKDESENLRWANKRFNETRTAFPDIHPAQAEPGGVASLEAILDSLTASVDPELAAAYKKIGGAVKISRLLKPSAY